MNTQHANAEVTEFRAAMRANGVPYAGEIIADGKLHRCYIEGDRRGSRNGWYLLHLDDKPAGAFGSMRSGGGKTTWSAKGTKPLTREERAALKRQMEGNKARRAKLEAEQRAAAAIAALEAWDAAKDADNNHPYLRRKQVNSYGLKVGTWVRDYGSDPVTGEVRESRIENALLVPIRNHRRQIVSLQGIFPSDKNALKRNKDYLAGGEKRGCYYAIGKPTGVDGSTVIALCEGYATGASIHAATGLGVLVCFDAGNLLPVGQVARRLMKDAMLLFCADNDAWTDTPVKNPGIMRATEAAASVGGKVVYPKFAVTETKPTDFNDLQVLEGIAEVERQIFSALRPQEAGPDLPEPPPHDEPPPAPEPSYGVETPAAEPEATTVETADDDEEPDEAIDGGGYFTVLGHDRDRIYIYQHEKRMVTVRGESSWDKKALISIAPLQWWEMNFRGEKGLNADMAMNWLVRTAFRRGFYDPSISRGRGAWLDDGRIVYHFGHMLTVDGEQMPVQEIKSRYVYEQSRHMPLPADEPLTHAEGKLIYDIATKFRWSRPASAVLLAGFVALAPICGALRWRPHIWLTGGAGSGKSTILNEYVHFLMNGAALYAQGNSTEAGIRQTLRNDALPVLFDESEQNNEREQNRMESVIALIRQSSTESEARTLKGTTNGTAMDFMIRSIFCLSSIQVGLKHQADHERISILALRPKREAEDAAEEWKVLRGHLADLHRDRTLPARLLRRSLNLLPITVKNIDTFAAAAAMRFGSQREGDQYGALLAGAHSLVADRLVMSSEAEQMIDRYDWSDYLEHSETEESTKVLSTVMGTLIRMPGGETACVEELLRKSLGMRVDGISALPRDARAMLRRYGIIVKDKGKTTPDWYLLILYEPRELLKLIADTPYSADLKNQLLRLRGAVRYDRTQSREGGTVRCVGVPMSLILGDRASQVTGRSE